MERELAIRREYAWLFGSFDVVDFDSAKAFRDFEERAEDYLDLMVHGTAEQQRNAHIAVQEIKGRNAEAVHRYSSRMRGGVNNGHTTYVFGLSREQEHSIQLPALLPAGPLADHDHTHTTANSGFNAVHVLRRWKDAATGASYRHRY
jgi:hypothetical protein